MYFILKDWGKQLETLFLVQIFFENSVFIQYVLITFFLPPLLPDPPHYPPTQFHTLSFFVSLGNRKTKMGQNF